MIEHVSVPISDYKKSKQLYLEALKPLDYVLGSDYPSDAAGFYEGGHTSFWIVKKKEPVQPIHVALRAPSKEPCISSIPRRSRPARRIMGRRGFGASTATITTPRSCSTSMVTISKRVTSAKRRRLNEPARRERLLNVAG